MRLCKHGKKSAIAEIPLAEIETLLNLEFEKLLNERLFYFNGKRNEKIS